MWKLRCYKLAQATVRFKEATRAKAVNLCIFMQQNQCTHKNIIRFDKVVFLFLLFQLLGCTAVRDAFYAWCQGAASITKRVG